MAARIYWTNPLVYDDRMLPAVVQRQYADDTTLGGARRGIVVEK
jgi:hypothetical protein